MSDENNSFRHPVAAIALLLVISVVALIGAAVFGIDRGVLANMADREYARGLITFLFAVVTIGTALVLVVAALIGSSSDAQEKRFQQGKEVLSLLLGVFGTIIGYYFGSSVQRAAIPPLRVSALQIVPATASRGAEVAARALVAGGVSPYRYSIFLGETTSAVDIGASESGDISARFRIPASISPAASQLRLLIVDTHGEKVTVVGELSIR